MLDAAHTARNRARDAAGNPTSTSPVPGEKISTPPETYAAMLRDIGTNRVLFDAIFYQIAEDMHLSAFDVCEIAKAYCGSDPKTKAEAFHDIECRFIDTLKAADLAQV